MRTVSGMRAGAPLRYPLGKANLIHSSSDTTENIINPQFRKPHSKICNQKKPSPAEKVARLAATDEEDKIILSPSIIRTNNTNIRRAGLPHKNAAAP